MRLPDTMERLSLTTLTTNELAKALLKLPVGETLAIVYSSGRYLSPCASVAADLAKSAAANMLGMTAQVRIRKLAGRVEVTREGSK